MCLLYGTFSLFGKIWTSGVVSDERGDDIELRVGDNLLGERALLMLSDGQVITACQPHCLTSSQQVRVLGDGADARVLTPVTYDPGGRRWSEFASAVSRMRVEPTDDFPLEG